MPFTSDGSAERAALRQAERLTGRAARASLRRLRSAVPVRTGRMRAACRIQRRAFGPTTIRSVVPYARWVDGYHVAVRVARAAAQRQLRGFEVTVRFVEGNRVRRVRVKIARSRAFRVQGGRNAVVIRTAKRFSFRMRANGRVTYQARF